jgi:hypothetical protein
MGRQVTCLVEMTNAYKILVGKCEGKKPPTKSTFEWYDNINVEVRGTQNNNYITSLPS